LGYTILLIVCITPFTEMLDLRTLVIALTITFTLQAIIFLLMTVLNNWYRGMRLWAYGSFCLAMSFISIYLRSFGGLDAVLIIVSNLTSISAALLFYVGTKRLLNIPFKLFWPLLFLGVFTIIITYYTFFFEQLNVRTIVFSVTMALILLRISMILMVNRRKSYRSSAWVLSSFFIIFGIFFVFRAVYTVIHPIAENNIFGYNTIQVLTLLFSLFFGIICTQGIILLVNQKLQGELTEKTEKLESTNNEKDKFFSVLAHDLRGPLTAIMGMVDLMADKETKLGEKLMQEMASTMKESVHSTNILLDNLLDWASLQRGLKAIHQKNTTYGELMALEMPTLIVQAANKNITIIDDIPEITPLKADPILVQSVFRNLITNAIKFTPTNGTIRLTSYISDDGRLIFSIVDSGIGMDNQLLKHLFEFGPRSQRPGTDGESSNGMGLMICKEFVEKHGGRIWVESVVNKGSTFSFCLEPVE